MVLKERLWTAIFEVNDVIVNVLEFRGFAKFAKWFIQAALIWLYPKIILNEDFLNWDTDFYGKNNYRKTYNLTLIFTALELVGLIFMLIYRCTTILN